jgi:hypothetical protein
MPSVHVVTMGIVNITAGGEVKQKSQMTIGEVINNSSTGMRVLPNPLVPSSIGFPTLEAYLIAEALSGFVLNHLDQYTIITYG